MSKPHFRFARSSGHLRPCSSGRMLQPQTFRRTPGAPVRARRSLRTSQTVACTAVMTSGVSRNGLGARGRGLSPLAGYGRELRARRLTRPCPSRLSYQRSCKPACSVGYRAHQSMACEKVQRRWPTHTRSIQTQNKLSDVGQRWLTMSNQHRAAQASSASNCRKPVFRQYSNCVPVPQRATLSVASGNAMWVGSRYRQLIAALKYATRLAAFPRANPKSLL